MALLETNRQNKNYTKSLLSFFVLAAIVFAVLLISSAVELASSTGQVTGQIGPLQLFELSKSALPGGGYSGNLRLLTSGIVTYLGFSLATGLLVAHFRQTCNK